MYAQKPYYDPNLIVTVPENIYKLPNYHEIIKESENTSQSGSNIDVTALKQLEARQENILKKLELLQKQVDELTGKKSSRAAAEGLQGESQGVKDVVISAHPDSPPIGLFVMQQLLASQYKVLTSCHRHSSAPGASEKHMAMLNSSQRGVATDRNLYDIIFTLIWKDEKYGPSMMVNPRLQTSIQGEGNIARYLAKLLNSPYDQGDIVIATEIDQWVDSAAQFQRGNSKEKASVLKAMNAKLGKSDWLVSSSMSLADVMLWGAITQAEQGTSAPGNVKKWYQRCSDLNAYKVVLGRL